MPISSLVLRIEDGRAASVSEAVDALSGATVTHVEGGNLVVVTETADRDADKAIWEQLNGIDGVGAVELIYHNFEDMEGESNG